MYAEIQRGNGDASDFNGVSGFRPTIVDTGALGVVEDLLSLLNPAW
jgi:hypothetical protein